MNIVLIGSGHVAYHFGKSFLEKGHTIQQVYSRTPEHAELLANTLGASPLSIVSDMTRSADIYLIAVQDGAIESLAAQLPRDLSGIVVHTSGATSRGVIDRFGRYGVIYPLQSLRKEVDADFRQIPIAVEGNTASSQKKLLELASELSDQVFYCSGEQRLVLHLSAVFANNFTNALYDIAYRLTAEYGLPFDLLRPVILKTAENIKTHTPSTVQTGPASRDDQNVINLHLDFLKKYPDCREIYKLISSYIQKAK